MLAAFFAGAAGRACTGITSLSGRCRRILSGTICPLKYLSSWCWAAWATSAARCWQPVVHDRALPEALRDFCAITGCSTYCGVAYRHHAAECFSSAFIGVEGAGSRCPVGSADCGAGKQGTGGGGIMNLFGRKKDSDRADGSRLVPQPCRCGHPGAGCRTRRRCWRHGTWASTSAA